MRFRHAATWIALTLALSSTPAAAEVALFVSPTDDLMLHSTAWFEVWMYNDVPVQNIQLTSKQDRGYFVTLQPPWTYPTLNPWFDQFQCTVTTQWFSGTNVTFTIGCNTPIPPGYEKFMSWLVFGSLPGVDRWYGGCTATVNDPFDVIDYCGVWDQDVWVH